MPASCTPGPLAPDVAPAAGVVVLTVDERNHAGLRACAKAGLVDVGRSLGGAAGPPAS